jgi:hypothetical protein
VHPPSCGRGDSRQLLDGCEVGASGSDIQSLESRYDAKRDQILVTLRLCAKVDRTATYQLHVDHSGTQVEEAGAPLGFASTADTVLVRSPVGHKGPAAAPSTAT